jgi:hypothetical protein
MLHLRGSVAAGTRTARISATGICRGDPTVLWPDVGTADRVPVRSPSGGGAERRSREGEAGAVVAMEGRIKRDMKRRTSESATRRSMADDIVLFARACTYCVAVRIALWMMPTRALLRLVHRRVEEVAGLDGSAGSAAQRIAWSVRAAGRRLPYTTCLVEALAAQLLLARRGVHSGLRIGVQRDDEGRFEAHAWVDVKGEVIVGARPGMRYHVLPDLAKTLE